MSIPKIELMKGYDVVPNNSPIDNPRTFQASSVQELLDATLTPTKVITSWGFGKTLQAALLAGIQGAPEGHNQPPLPVEPDKSLVNGMIPVTYPSQAGRRS
ncbi:MAG TPA: hypothetical protein VNY04_04975 [Chthoniobacterales bacterium]|jgi:hypothetical protein|nr:hypothetical protein [Chthoniobacterales bacterium]